MKVKFYSGLCLTKADVKKLAPGFDFALPLARGELKNDIKAGYHIIGIADGRFYNQLAVSPSEIMDCLRLGIKVFGSSSMGALRAAELDIYGMAGVGEIYNLIKVDKKFEDDFLGQTFFEEEYCKTSTPYVDLYIALQKMKAQKFILDKEIKYILAAYRELHYTERNVPKLIQILKKSKYDSLNSNLMNRLLKLPSAKREDAKSLIKAIHQHQKDILKFRKESEL